MAGANTVHELPDIDIDELADHISEQVMDEFAEEEWTELDDHGILQILPEHKPQFDRIHQTIYRSLRNL